MDRIHMSSHTRRPRAELPKEDQRHPTAEACREERRLATDGRHNPSSQLSEVSDRLVGGPESV
jgi:hypothetical protein